MFKVIMHKNAMDVAFDVYKVRRYKPGYVDLKGRWLNLGYVGKPWVLDHAKLRLTEKQYKDWADITSWYDIKRHMSGRPKCHSCGSTSPPIEKINNIICADCRTVLGG